MHHSGASRRENAKPYPLSSQANAAQRFALAAGDIDISKAQTKGRSTESAL
jgi:hypothetical protein